MNIFFYTCAVLFFVYGIVIGSFLNVYIYRTPIKESLIKGGSHCTSCNTPILKRDLVPLFSWLFLRGKCRACGAKISFRYPFVEFLNGFLYLISFIIFGLNATSILCCILISVLICLTFIDLDHKLVPDCLIVTLFVIGALDLCIKLGFIPFLENGISDVTLVERIIGFFAISVPIFIIGGITGGMGGGDVKLFAALGFLLGWKAALLILLISSVSASIIGIIIIANRKRNKNSDETSETSESTETVPEIKTENETDQNIKSEKPDADEDDDFEDLSESENAIPFVPYISFGAVITILFGNQIIEYYLNLFM